MCSKLNSTLALDDFISNRKRSRYIFFTIKNYPLSRSRKFLTAHTPNVPNVTLDCIKPPRSCVRVRRVKACAAPQGVRLYEQHSRCREALTANDKQLKIIFQEAVTCRFPFRSPSHHFIGSESANNRTHLTPHSFSPTQAHTLTHAMEGSVYRRRGLWVMP